MFFLYSLPSTFRLDDKQKERKTLRLKTINTNKNSIQIWKGTDKGEKKYKWHDRGGQRKAQLFKKVLADSSWPWDSIHLSVHSPQDLSLPCWGSTLLLAPWAPSSYAYCCSSGSPPTSVWMTLKTYSAPWAPIPHSKCCAMNDCHCNPRTLKPGWALPPTMALLYPFLPPPPSAIPVPYHSLLLQQDQNPWVAQAQSITIIMNVLSLTSNRGQVPSTVPQKNLLHWSFLLSFWTTLVPHHGLPVHPPGHPPAQSRDQSGV